MTNKGRRGQSTKAKTKTENARPQGNLVTFLPEAPEHILFGRKKSRKNFQDILASSFPLKKNRISRATGLYSNFA